MSYKSLINFNKSFYSFEILMGKANGYLKEIGFKIIFINLWKNEKLIDFFGFFYNFCKNGIKTI